MKNNINSWLTRLQYTCHEAGLDYFDFIVDQCAFNFSVLPDLRNFTPPLQWCSLFQGLPEEGLADDAPLLIRVLLDTPYQLDFFTHLAGTFQPAGPLLVIGSRWPFSELASWLTSCVEAAHEGRRGLFRYYDPRLLPFLFSDILTDTQQQQLLQPALFWSWLDRDNQPQLITGHDAPSPGQNEKCQKIDFSDAQLETMMCICDAKRLSDRWQIPEAMSLSHEEQFTVCYRGMLAATEAGILLDNDRDTWVLKWLAEQYDITL